jgi:hypothetical protein
MLALLNFDEYFVEEVYVKANPKFEKKDWNEGAIAISFDIKRKEMEPNFMIPVFLVFRRAPMRRQFIK